MADGFKKAGYTLTFGLVSARQDDLVNGVTEFAVNVSDKGEISYIGGASSACHSNICWGNGKVAWASGGQSGTVCGLSLLDILPESGDTLRQIVTFGAIENPTLVCRGYVVAYKEGSAPILMYTPAVTHQYLKDSILL